MDDNNLPLDPGTTLKKGITKIYGAYSYSGLKSGMKFAYYWFHNGKEFVSLTDGWSGEESGSSWANAYYTSGKSLPTGNWQQVIYVDGELMKKVTCIIR